MTGETMQISSGDLIFKPLNQRVQSMLSTVVWERLQILPARFSNEAGIIGNAALAADAVQKVGNGHPGTAMSLAPMTRLARWLDATRQPVLAQLPDADYAALQAAWDLPRR